MSAVPGLQDIEGHSIIAWIVSNKIRNEKGDLIEFRDHPFLYDIYRDQAQNLVVVKAAQVGLSTCEILRNHYDAKSQRMDIIYTLPTDGDVQKFVGGKVNRIIANNPCMLEDVADKDSIEQKAIGSSMMYFFGTWTAKAAIMTTADRLVHDEKDSSKLPVVRDYQARLQHSKFKQTHVFSHPSVPGQGVDEEWQKSDQKEWFVDCPHCGKAQFLSWNTTDPRRMSVDLERREFVCKACAGILSPEARRGGRWVKRRLQAKWSGYHISLLMAPWVTAGEIADKWAEVVSGKQTEEWFWNKVLGLPYAGSGNTVSREAVLGNIRPEKNAWEGRLVVGVDTGVKLRYVVGNKQGLVGYGEMTDYTPDDVNGLPLDRTVEYFLVKFPDSIMVIDQGGDIIGSRKLQKKYPGRVFLCHYARDRKTQQLMRWGDKDEYGTVLADRNRLIQLVVDELNGGRIGLYNGNEADWHDYWLHWSHIRRVAEEDALGVLRHEWVRSDRDDWVHATVYWRIGVSRFGTSGMVSAAPDAPKPDSYLLNPDGSVSFDPEEMFQLPPAADDEDESEWR